MLYELAKPPVALVVRAVWNPVIRGADRIPERGPVILASNHLAAVDTVFFPAMVSRTVHFLGKSDFFRGGSLVSSVIAVVMRGLHVMPVHRGGGRASRTAIDAGLHVLRGGRALGIYPEGTRSPDGRLHRGRTGVARLALTAGAPVLPVAMLGTFEAQKGRRFLPRRRPRIVALVGEPIDVAGIAAQHPDLGEGARLRLVTDTVMQAIQDLSGQEYVDEYASEVKRRKREDSGDDAGDDTATGPGITA